MNKTKGRDGSGLAIPAENVLGSEWLTPSQIARQGLSPYSADAIRKKALAGEIAYRRSRRLIFIHRSEIEVLLGKEYPAKRSATR